MIWQKKYSNSDLFKLLCSYQLSFNNPALDHMQQQPGSAQKPRKILKDLFPEDPSTMQDLVKYTKKVGAVFIHSLEQFFEGCKKTLFRDPSLPQEFDNYQNKTGNEQGDQKDKKKGFKRNFQTFEYDQDKCAEVSFTKVPQKQEPRPVRSFTFNMEQIKEENSIEANSRDDLSFFVSRIGTKKVKREEVILKNDPMLQAIQAETPQIRQHFNQLHNSFIADYSVMMSNFQEKSSREAKKPANEDEENWQNYLKSIQKGYQLENDQEFPRPKRDLLKPRKARSDQRPPRKKIHLEKETPQIYNVEKVLEVLQTQKKNCLAEKLRKREQILKAQRERRQFEAAQQRERKEKEAREAEKRRLQEQQAQEARTRAAQEASKQEKKADGLQVISERQESIPYNAPEDDAESFGMSSRRQRPLEELSPSVQGGSPKLQENKSQQSQAQQPQQEAYQTPPRGIPQQQSQISPAVVQQQPSFPPPASEQKKSEKKNPFIKSSPAKPISLQDLMSKDPRPTPFQSLFGGGAPPSVFNQSNPMPSIFNSQPQQPKDRQEPPMMFQSPTTCMDNRIGMFPPTQSMPQAQMQQTQFNSNSPLNNSSFQSCNPDNSAQFNQNNNQSNQPVAAPSFFNPVVSSGTNMFSNNPNTPKLFQNNMFMTSQPQRSLFGDNPQPTQPTTSARVSNRNKRPVRIS